MNAVRRQLLIAGFTVLACGLLLGGIILAGKLARNALNTTDRYQLPFTQIECPAPLGLSREAFLGEVRYYGELPETIPVFDEQTPARLSAAFARHPWVEKVERIEVNPNRRVQVTLIFRTPVLAVVYPDNGPTVRAVDGAGVLLPRGADTLNLPHLEAKSAPAGAGKPWGDAQVESAAHIAGLLHPHQSKLELKDVRWSDGQLCLRRTAKSGPEVIWGSPNDGEAKLRRLLERIVGAKPDAVIDVRTD